MRKQLISEKERLRALKTNRSNCTLHHNVCMDSNSEARARLRRRNCSVKQKERNSPVGGEKPRWLLWNLWQPEENSKKPELKTTRRRLRMIHDVHAPPLRNYSGLVLGSSKPPTFGKRGYASGVPCSKPSRVDFTRTDNSFPELSEDGTK